MTFLVGTTNETLTFGIVQTPDGGPLGTFALMTLTPKGGAPVLRDAARADAGLAAK